MRIEPATTEDVSDLVEAWVALAETQRRHGSHLHSTANRRAIRPILAYHVVDGSTFCIDNGYHPCAVLPGYEMYYFTILGGASQRPLVQYFQPSHADQIETIPGIKDMIAKFK